MKLTRPMDASLPHLLLGCLLSACLLLLPLPGDSGIAGPETTPSAGATGSVVDGSGAEMGDVGDPGNIGFTPDFATLAARHGEQAREDRRWLHANPELSWRENGTQEYLQRALAAIPGVELVEGDWETGVVAILRGGRPGPLLGWRTDMDALPIEEATDLPFASTARDSLSGGRVASVMHACGHDMHMGIALGLARVLSDVREQLPGSLLIVGQPAEEIGAGALTLLDAGLFAGGRKPHRMFALHVHPTIPFGQIGSCPGWATANVDGFVLKVKGDGGHGAYPHRGVDPVTLAAQMVLAFQTLVGREIDVNHHAVISVGRIEAGTKSNVIPAEVLIEATVRSQDDATRQLLAEKIERTVRGLAQAAGAPEPEFEYYFGTAAGYNDPGLVAEARSVFRRVLGAENEILYPAGMGGEDFAYFGQQVPGFQFRLGVAVEGRDMSLHRSNFAPVEDAIELGMRLGAEVIWDQLLRAQDAGVPAWEPGVEAGQ